ncbi:hypothetical protein L1987_16603 [Smallanthus sonchifolius]|uniref:Uncharacterized protein n=1 Tax=Smallanthus sonchifolius TaxID=185202 RepID=A0ACB9IVP1_9ASTR|nr:hypothetical protein L1987_16603 [Smallanthus sonchifolius]
MCVLFASFYVPYIYGTFVRLNDMIDVLFEVIMSIDREKTASTIWLNSEIHIDEQPPLTSNFSPIPPNPSVCLMNSMEEIPVSPARDQEVSDVIMKSVDEYPLLQTNSDKISPTNTLIQHHSDNPGSTMKFLLSVSADL